MPDSPERPKLRSLEVQRVEQEGEAYFLIKDPRRMAEKALMVRQEMGPFLAQADGSKTVEEIISSASASGATGPTGPGDAAVKDLFQQLDGLFLLDGQRYENEVKRRLDEYRSADFRIPSLEGQAYPEDPDDLLDFMEAFAPDISSEQEPSSKTLKAIVSPHIDYNRGGETYAELWRGAAPDLEDIELAVIFGTDHQGAGPRLTLTEQSYATAWNILPTDTDLVSKLARVLKADSSVENHPFADEANHLSEHSIELASIWLNWAIGDNAVRVLPILCGSLGDYVQEEGKLRDAVPSDHPQIADAIGLLQQTARHRRTLFVAAADLSHVGPVFGDEEESDDLIKREIEEHDEELMSAVIKGDHRTFLDVLKREHDYSRVCGLAPIYMALWAAEATDGHWLGYQQCPADESGASFVSIAGALLY